MVSAAIKAYRRKHPLVDIQLTKLETPLQLESLVHGQLDIGFLRPPTNYPTELTGFIVLSHPLIAALPSDHRLARAREVRVTDLREEDFIVPTVEIELAFENHTGRIATRGKFVPRITHRRPDILTIVTLVAAGLGVAVVPNSFQAVHIPGVVYKPIAPPESANSRRPSARMSAGRPFAPSSRSCGSVSPSAKTTTIASRAGARAAVAVRPI